MHNTVYRKGFFSKLACIVLLSLLSACGYRFDTSAPITVSIPYVVGDNEGAMTNALISALSNSSNFRYTTGKGDWILKAKITGSIHDRIGYRYDRDPKSGKLRDNVIGIENRRAITLEVSVIDANSEHQILGPQILQATADYDYVDPNSLQDLSFIDPSTGSRLTSIAFSLGQLDSVGSAGEDVMYPIYQKLAQKIVEGMIASGNFNEE